MARRRAVATQHRFGWLITACTIIAMFLGLADQMIVGAAMPQIITSLAGFHEYAWVTTAYLLGVTVTVPLYGKLADLGEAKWVYLFGLLLFVGASALCGFAHSMSELIAYRALQGVGGGALIPVSLIVLRAFVKPERRAMVQGGAGSLVLMATVAGPVIGGWVTDHASWRWVFYINVPIGLVIAVILAVLMPRLRIRHGAMRIDYLGTALLVVATVSLLIVVSLPARERSFIGGGHVGLLLLLAGLACVLFIVQEAQHPEPIVDPRVFAVSTFNAAAAGVALLAGVMFASVIYIPLYVQGVLGHSATRGGLVLTPLMLSSMSGRFITNRLQARRAWIQPIALCCLGGVVAGALLLALLGPSSTVVQVVAAMILLGIGLGGSNALLFGAATDSFARRQFGQATGTIFFLRSIGGAVALGALGGLLATNFAGAMVAILRRAAPQLLHSTSAAILTAPHLLLAHLNLLNTGRHPILHAMQKALAISLHDVFLIILAMAVLAWAIVAMCPLWITRKAEDAAATTEGSLALGGAFAAPDNPPAGVSAPQLSAAWDIMRHILYWRHGVLQATEESAPSFAFNHFEDIVTLPTSLREPTLAGVFDRAWRQVRMRSPLDRYRAESVVRLLWDGRHLDGDVAVVSGMGDGVALLLALVIRGLGLPKRVYLYERTTQQTPHGNGVPERWTGRRDGETRDAFLAQNDLLGVLMTERGTYGDTLAAIDPRQRFCVIHLNADNYPTVNLCLHRLLPRAAPGAAVVIEQYHGGQQGPRRATQEYLRHAGGRLSLGPLPQAYFFVTASPQEGNAGPTAVHGDMDWTELRSNAPYRDFLRWIEEEVAACYASAHSSPRDRRVVAAIDNLTLPERADTYISRLLDALA